MEIKKPVEQRFHEQTEIYYVISGDAELWINGFRKVVFSACICIFFIGLKISENLCIV